MNASKVFKSAASLVAPAARRAASQATKEGSGKMNPLVWAIPPALIIFGYGGSVVMSDGGSFHRIVSTFGSANK